MTAVIETMTAFRVDAPALCSSCSQPLESGAAAWRSSTLHADGVSSSPLCLTCARPNVLGTPGRSARAIGVARRYGLAAAQRGTATEDAGLKTRGRHTVEDAIAVLGFAIAIVGIGVGLCGGTAAPFGPLMFWAGFALLVAGLVRRTVDSARRHAADIDAPERSVDTTWEKGARGEQHTATALDRSGQIALHDRARPGMRANLDHLVITPSAVYVIDSKNYAGTLTIDRGTLRIDGRGQTPLLDAVIAQAGHVRDVLRDAGFTIPVRPVLSFTGRAYPTANCTVKGVGLVTPSTVRAHVSQPGPDPDITRVGRVADLLAWTFPPA